jgi:hypothetical protein
MIVEMLVNIGKKQGILFLTGGVRIPFSKEAGTRRKIAFVHFRARWCLDVSYLSFYNMPLQFPENGEPAWISSPSFSEARVPVPEIPISDIEKRLIFVLESKILPFLQC